jgi:hypothetical protein
MLRRGHAFLVDVLNEAKRHPINAREIEKAARWLGVIEKKIDGAIVWERPSQLARLVVAQTPASVSLAAVGHGLRLAGLIARASKDW